MLRRTAALVAVLVVIALPGTASAEPDPMAGAPAVGDCFDITRDQGYDVALKDEEPVDCAGDHTAVVAAVGKLPARLDWDSPAKAIGDAELKVCNPGWDDLIGANETNGTLFHRSMYALWLFQPTRAQKNDGARWFDCMVTIENSRGLADLPQTLPRLRRHLPDFVDRCATRKRQYTTCDRAHAWRETYSYEASGTLTQEHVDAAAHQHCPGHVTSRRWLYGTWDAPGRHFVGVCLSKTSG